MQHAHQSTKHIITMNLRGFATSFAALSSEEKKSQRVIGGRESTQGRYSYAVSLADDLGSFCGGSMIAPDIVLSAAHCAGGDYRVISGRHDLDTDEGDEVEVLKEIVHPQYEPFTTDNDFMVLVLVSLFCARLLISIFATKLILINISLNKERPTNAKVSMVQLNNNDTIPEVGSECVVMGWGDTTQDDYTVETSSILMEVAVNAISNKACAKSEGTHNGYEDSYEGQITEHMLCAKGKSWHCKNISGV
jgi:trypsin